METGPTVLTVRSGTYFADPLLGNNLFFPYNFAVFQVPTIQMVSFAFREIEDRPGLPDLRVTVELR